MIPLSDSQHVSRTKPYVNYGLIGLCALVFLFELALGPAGRDRFFVQYGLIPIFLTQGFDVTSITAGVPPLASIFTSMFIHASISHFGFNMLFLWVFGNRIEERLGHAWYLIFYLGVGVVASLTQVAVDPAGQVPTIGASGAIAGVLGAYLLLYPFSRIRTMVILIFISFIQVRAWLLLGFWIILQFFGGLGSLGPSSQSGGVAYFAHVGGFAAGVVVIGALKLFLWREPLWPRRRGPDLWWRGRQI